MPMPPGPPPPPPPPPLVPFWPACPVLPFATAVPFVPRAPGPPVLAVNLQSLNASGPDELRTSTPYVLAPGPAVAPRRSSRETVSGVDTPLTDAAMTGAFTTVYVPAACVHVVASKPPAMTRLPG